MPKIDKWEDIEAYLFVLDENANPVTIEICGQPVDSAAMKTVGDKSLNYIGVPFPQNKSVKDRVG